MGAGVLALELAVSAPGPVMRATAGGNSGREMLDDVVDDHGPAALAAPDAPSSEEFRKTVGARATTGLSDNLPLPPWIASSGAAGCPCRDIGDIAGKPFR